MTSVRPRNPSTGEKKEEKKPSKKELHACGRCRTQTFVSHGPTCVVCKLSDNGVPLENSEAAEEPMDDTCVKGALPSGFLRCEDRCKDPPVDKEDNALCENGHKLVPRWSLGLPDLVTGPAYRARWACPTCEYPKFSCSHCSMPTEDTNFCKICEAFCCDWRTWREEV